MPKVKVKVPHRSGFDKSHKNLLTATVGTLVPILCDELIPNTKVHLASAISACLPPLATDTFMRVNLKVEAFFVPTRLLYGGFEPWLTKEPLRNLSTQVPCYAKIPVVNRLATSAQAPIDPYYEAGTLADYLGIKYAVGGSAYVGSQLLNIFPFLAYHKIWSDMYRNTNIQADCFCKPLLAADQGQIRIYNMPYVTFDNSVDNTNPTFTLNAQLADGVHLGDLRQRNFGFDYFTGAFNAPQRGDALKVSIDTSDDTFTIAALRAANSLQQFAERNQMAGYRLQDFVRANYGADLSNGVAQRTIYLGSGEIPVYNKGVYQTSPHPTSNGSGDPTQNPFAGPEAAAKFGQGAKFGDASANGKLSLVDNFVAEEPGYLMVLASLVPVVTYASGVDRRMLRYNSQDSQTDLATPLLQNVGNQPIMAVELTGVPSNNVFGYTDRYADFKHINDQLHGLVRDGESMDAFALQRTVTGNPQISSTFLEIPQSYMDQVTVVNGWLSQYGVWIDSFFDYKVSMPLAEYSIPSLQDPAYEHGQDVLLDLNGSKIN